MNLMAAARRRHLFWSGVFGAIVIIAVYLLYAFADRVHIHSLPTGKIHLALDKQFYQVGEPVAFTITNRLDTTIYVDNQCPREPLDVFRWNGQAWEPVHATAPVDSCAGGLRQVPLAPGAATAGSYGNWSNLFAQPGRYRVVLAANNYRDLSYQDLVVSPAPTPIPSPPPAPALTATPRPQVIARTPAPVIVTPMPRPAKPAPPPDDDDDDD